MDKEDRDGVVIHDSIGRQQKAVIINESGLYALILSSQLEQARAFTRWTQLGRRFLYERLRQEGIQPNTLQAPRQIVKILKPES